MNMPLKYSKYPGRRGVEKIRPWNIVELSGMREKRMSNITKISAPEQSHSIVVSIAIQFIGSMQIGFPKKGRQKIPLA